MEKILGFTATSYVGKPSNVNTLVRESVASVSKEECTCHAGKSVKSRLFVATYASTPAVPSVHHAWNSVSGVVLTASVKRNAAYHVNHARNLVSGSVSIWNVINIVEANAQGNHVINPVRRC